MCSSNLIICDEYSRYPFVFPCREVSAKSVVKHLQELFALFGMPAYMHSDRGSAFMSSDLKQFLLKKGIATSRTTSYNPAGNGRVENRNGTIWQAITLLWKPTSNPLIVGKKFYQMHYTLCILCYALQLMRHPMNDCSIFNANQRPDHQFRYGLLLRGQLFLNDTWSHQSLIHWWTKFSW